MGEKEKGNESLEAGMEGERWINCSVLAIHFVLVFGRDFPRLLKMYFSSFNTSKDPTSLNKYT
jgi:hypothetical protein